MFLFVEGLLINEITNLAYLKVKESEYIGD